jgi:hypothetical protein
LNHEEHEKHEEKQSKRTGKLVIPAKAGIQLLRRRTAMSTDSS